MFQATIGLLVLTGLSLFFSILSVRNLRKRSKSRSIESRHAERTADVTQANTIKSDAMKMAAGGSANNEISVANSGR
jgi:hypothetical protein